MKHKNVTS